MEYFALIPTNRQEMEGKKYKHYFLDDDFLKDGDVISDGKDHYRVAMNTPSPEVARLRELLREAREALDMCQFMMNQTPSQEALQGKLGWTPEYCKSWVNTHTKADDLAQRINKELGEV